MGVVTTTTIIVLLCVVRLVASEPPSRRPLNVALHAQSRYSVHGWVAGSEVTTEGMRRALARHPSVNHVEVFAPFVYSALPTQERWDLVVVEGYTGSVPKFIHAMRAHSPSVRIVHYCLDTYPRLNDTLNLDVDGFLTNSATLPADFEKRGFPAATVLLAADPDIMAPVPPQQRYAHNVVYLGQMSLTKYNLTETLLELAPLGLAIYGMSWDRFDESAALLPYWHGILPLDDIPALYSSARVIVGTTETKQRDFGMINNRVFEALSAGGGALVSDSFEALERAVGKHARYVRAPGDARRHVEELLGDERARRGMAAGAREFVIGAHTYDHRVAQILSFYNTRLRDTSRERPHLSPGRRPNRPSVLLVYEDGSNDWALQLGLIPALVALEAQGHDWTLSLHRHSSSESLPADACATFTLILVRDRWGGRAERAVRDLGGCKAARGLLLRPTALLLQPAASAASAVELSLMYDVIVHDGLSEFVHPHHPNVVRALGIDVSAVSRRVTAASSNHQYSHGSMWAPCSSTTFRWDEVHVGSLDSVSVETLAALPGTRLAVGPSTPGSAETLRAAGVEHWRGVSAEALPDVLCAAGRLLIFSQDEVALALAGVAAGAVISVPPESHRLVSLVRDAAELGNRDKAAFEAAWGLPQLVATLSAAFDRAAWGPRARARAEIVSPRHLEELDLRGPDESATLRVTVALAAFVVPDDGAWCLLVDGDEVQCFGDDSGSGSMTFHIDIPVERSPYAKRVRLRAGLRAGLDLDASTLSGLSDETVVVVMTELTSEV